MDGILNLDSIYNKVCRQLCSKESIDIDPRTKSFPKLTQEEFGWSLSTGESSTLGGRCLAVDGINYAKDFLERMEATGGLEDIDFLELRACNRGCLGGALTAINRFLTEERLRNRIAQLPITSAPLVSREEIEYLRTNLKTEPIQPMTKLLYKGDIEQVLSSMDMARKIKATLPGLDCGACGSPTCESLSHDIVRGEALPTNCVFMHIMPGSEDDGAMDQLENVWGRERFKK